ncbi:MAG: DUF1800 domain-containing protein [Gemmatimonadetes bacterium]|nr:DUF1800 domain-containing protein [Gemmatimonadota bacterium]
MRFPRLAPLVALALAAACAGGVPPGTAGRAGASRTEAPAPDEVGAAPREQTDDQQVLQALNRLGFGPRSGDAARVRTMGVDAWIARQLEPEALDDARAEQFAARFETLRGTPGELLEKYPPPAFVRQQSQRAMNDTILGAADSARFRDLQRNVQRMVGELQASRVAQAVLSERQLQEVMTDFWLNHFNVFIQKGPTMRHYLPSYERDVIRPRALGRFRDLLGAVARSPAMLTYLDNWQSMADSTHETLAEQRLRRPALARRPLQRRRAGLNENYGRELLELHTLGVDGGYTQQDVVNVARAFTGWTVDQPRQGGGFAFRPAMHDADEKVVLGRTLAGGRGEEDGEEVLDLVAAHPSTARFIATKLARRFVSDDPPPALVERATRTFTRTRGDIRQVVRTIVTSPEFFSRAAWRSKVKSPFEVVVSALRAVDADGDPSPRSALAIAQLGQPLWGHQAPNGWPEHGTEWMNTGAILNRINFGLVMGASRLPGASVAGWGPARTLARASREEQVEGVIAAILGGDVSPETRAILVSGANPLAGRAAAQAEADSVMRRDDDMAGSVAPPGMALPGGTPPLFGNNAGGPAQRLQNQLFRRLPPLAGLAQVVGLALGSPEFQRR